MRVDRCEWGTNGVRFTARQRKSWIIFALIGVLAGAAFIGAATAAQEQKDSWANASPAASPMASPVAGVTISIAGFAFRAATIEIPVGSTVTWVNKDMTPHTVTHRPESGEALFDSGLFSPGRSWSYTFNTPGTFTYYCLPHPNMVAQVVVT